ncbi:NHL repeat containing protein [Turneriella parva]|uniref:NHL repeat containing protein n=1 Tax=Turneriella parva (strain ATCC BAA-1111 / DSM 21527 / NCTC 11395 / H) TaxID=869212 RepID=I4B4S6_TURPD|nr:NHL repeat containing protein [Turneriella parva]AFM12283.1 NHL repeat containing protein [Turneriella parva DSM 21527]
MKYALVLLFFILNCSRNDEASAASSNSSGCVPTRQAGRSSNCALTLSLTVDTLAGPSQGTAASGDTDGTGSAARFNAVTGVTTDGQNIYSTDYFGHKIRKTVISSGVVSTLAGPGPGTSLSGDVDGIGEAARFSSMRAITTDGTNLYVADNSNNKIRKIVIASRAVTVLAGPAAGDTTSGDTDGTANDARFNNPQGIVTDGTNLFVADSLNRKVRKIVIASGIVSTLAGPAQGVTGSGDTDGSANTARFGLPGAMTTDGVNLYLCDSSNHKIRKIVIATGEVITLAGPAQGTTTSGDTDGTGNSARFNNPLGITTDGTSLYVADTSNQKIRKIVIATGAVTTVAGPAQGATTSGDTEGVGTSARFFNPHGITTDGYRLFVGEYWNHKIRRIN